MKKYYLTTLFLSFFCFLYSQIPVVIYEEPTPVQVEYDSIMTAVDKLFGSEDNHFYQRKEIDFEKNELSYHADFDLVVDSQEDLEMHPNSDFYHIESNMLFPYFFQNYKRKDIFEEIDNDKMFSVTYSIDTLNFFTVYLFPNSTGEEGRLREFFLKMSDYADELIDVAQRDEENFVQFKGLDYDVNGIERTCFGKESNVSRCSAYECGSWLLAIVHRSSSLLPADFEAWDKKIVTFFNPSDLVASKPFNLKSTIEFERIGADNSEMLGALWAAAMKKMEWAEKNVDARERSGGFPDMYIGMHIAGVKSFLEKLSKKKLTNPKSKRLYNQLTLLTESGYLLEFLMEQYEYLLILPTDTPTYFDDYRVWKEEHNIDIDWSKKRYNIVYRNLNY